MLHVSSNFTYPAGSWSHCGWITDVLLYLTLVEDIHVEVHMVWEGATGIQMVYRVV